MNEQQNLILARIEFLRAKRRYMVAVREAELALALKKTLPSYQRDKDVPALLRRQA